MKYFSYFSWKTGFVISCKLSPMETICMKCCILFSVKNKKIIINLSSAELAQRVVRVIKRKAKTPKVNHMYLIYYLQQVGKRVSALSFIYLILIYFSCFSSGRPWWLSWMRRPTGDQEVTGSTPAKVGNILS